MSLIDQMSLGVTLKGFDSTATTTIQALLEEEVSPLNIAKIAPYTSFVTASSTGTQIFPSGMTPGNNLRVLIWAEYADSEESTERVLTVNIGSNTLKMGNVFSAVVDSSTMTIDSSVPANTTKIIAWFYEVF